MKNGYSSDRSWWTAKEAADYARIHIETLYSIVKRRRKAPQHHRVGKQYRFPIEPFKQWADGPQK